MTNLDRHVERDRDDCVEDDCVGEEDEHADDGGALDVIRHDDPLPGQVGLEVVADQSLPECGCYRAKAAHGEQEKDDLRGDIRFNFRESHSCCVNSPR